MSSDTKTVQVYRVYIRATPQQVWDAITDPVWNARYGYPGTNEYELHAGGSFRAVMPAGMIGPDEFLGVDGEVLEADPPKRLVQTWRFRFDDAQMAEGFQHVEFDIHEEHGGVTRLTVTHDVTDAPIAAAMLQGDANLQEGGGGWAWILSGLKTVLETGGSIAS
jgi:uncharacterized protein YndB with AHSA1/START domain